MVIRFFSDLVVDRNKASFASEYFERYSTLMYCFVLLKRIEAALLVMVLGKAKAFQVSIERRSKLEILDMVDCVQRIWHARYTKRENDETDEIEKALQLKENCSTVLFYSFHGKYLHIWISNSSRYVSFHHLSHEDCILENLTKLLSICESDINQSSFFSADPLMDDAPILTAMMPQSDKFVSDIEHSQIPKLFNCENTLVQESKTHKFSWDQISGASQEIAHDLESVV